MSDCVDVALAGVHVRWGGPGAVFTAVGGGGRRRARGAWLLAKLWEDYGAAP